MKASTFLNLGMKDLAKGIILAVITAVVTIVSQTVEAGSLIFDWAMIGKVALLAALSYFLKNGLTNSKDQFATPEPK